MTKAASVILAVWPIGAMSQELTLPANAVLQTEQSRASQQVEVPIGRFEGGRLPVQAIVGDVLLQAWRVNTAGLTTAQLLEPLQSQLQDAGYDQVWTCASQACGGFDFRFALDVLPPPDMFVDLGDFRFLSAILDGQAVMVLVSRSDQAGFVHVTRIGGEAATLVEASAPELVPVVPFVDLSDFALALETNGRVILSDLTFQTGSSSLGDGDFASLQALAEYLQSNSDRRVALVGHTDAQGSLDGNIALSRRRAQAVLERLVSVYGVRRGQLEGQGMGYLAPIATNLTVEGRDANRRVEVIVTNTP